MKKAIRIILPILLAVCVLASSIWYLFIYDRGFTRDVLLTFARISDNQGSHKLATWFYNQAYSQAGNSDEVAIELAEQYKSSGNFTKAEFTLSKAIADGGGADVYIALCKTYVQQDKLLDAVTMLDNITNPDVKAQLDAMRPAAPTCTPAPGYYSQYLSVTLENADGGKLYAANDAEYPSTTEDIYTKPIDLLDGENTIYAVTVADNGLVSPLAIFGYTVGGVITKMEFQDPVLEAEIRNLLGVDADKELYNNDLWTIKELTMPSGVKNFKDLQNMIFLERLTIDKGVSGQLGNLSPLVNLTELNISGVAISQDELGVIGALPKLQNLSLRSCSLVGIAPLQKATGIVKLDLSGNSIRNLDALRVMGKLQELYLQNNAITDLSALASVAEITTLNIASNSIASIAPIGSLSKLTWLDASTNAITELGDFKKLTNLTYLNLKSNKLSNISALTACTALTDLNISSNALTDISSLRSMTGIANLDFSNNQVSKLPSFPTNCELSTINGSYNKISDLSPLSGLKNLGIINMDYNSGISSVKSLAKCPVLIKVNVYGTKVTNVSSLTELSIVVNYNPVSK